MLQENILKEAPCLNKKIAIRLPNVCRRILHSKQRILWSLIQHQQQELQSNHLNAYTKWQRQLLLVFSLQRCLYYKARKKLYAVLYVWDQNKCLLSRGVHWLVISSCKLQKNQLATFSWKMSQIKQNNVGGFVG